MEKLKLLIGKMNFESITSNDLKVFVDDLIESIKLLIKDKESIEEGVEREVSPKAKIRRPTIDLDSVQDKQTQNTISELWDYRNEILDHIQASMKS